MAGKIKHRFMPTCLTLHILGLFVVGAEITFGPNDTVNNDVIFEGENVILICGVNDMETNESIIFSIKNEVSGMFILINNSEVSAGRVFQIEYLNNKIQFTLPSVQMDDSGTYKCEFSSRDLGFQSLRYHLVISPSNTVQCRQNSTHKSLSTEVLKLSCFFITSNSDSRTFDWISTYSNGTSTVLPSNVTVLNDVKGHLVSYIQPSEMFFEANYSCRLSSTLDGSSPDQPLGGCNAGSFIVYSKPLVMFSPNVQTISPGKNVTISCSRINIPTTSTFSIIPIWVLSPHQGQVKFKRDGTVLEISVPRSVFDGENITATCEAFIDRSVLTYPLLITIKRPMVTSKIDTDDNNPTENTFPTTSEINTTTQISVIVIIIIVLAVIGFIVIILLVIICWSLCAHGRDKETTNDTSGRSSPVYGIPSSRRERKQEAGGRGDGDLSENNQQPAVYDNRRLSIGQESKDSDEDILERVTPVAMERSSDGYDLVGRNSGIGHPNYEENRV